MRGHRSTDQGGAWQWPKGWDREDRHCIGTSQSEATAEDLGLQHKARRMPPQLGGGGRTVLPLWALVQGPGRVGHPAAMKPRGHHVQ